jgi:diguanylate cyclase (GGDEF)-like protein
MSDPNLPSLSPEILAAQELARLRFGYDEEAQFRIDYEASAIGARMTLFGLGIAMIGMTPLYDQFLLRIPQSFLAFSRSMQFGVEIPALIFAAVMTWSPRLRHWSGPATVLAMMLVVMGLTFQQVVGPAHGFHVPHDLAAMAIAGTCLMGRLRLVYLMPWAVPLMLIVSIMQLHGHGYSSGAFYDVISMWMLFTLAGIVAYHLEYSARESWRQRRKLEEQAAHDALTGLPNRRYFDTMFVHLIRQAARERKNIALMILDVDHFKNYNDRYGHPAGDDCLRRVGHWLKDAMRRPQDFCARIGGEEFAAVWFDAQIAAGPALAEKVRAGISELGIPHAASPTSAVVSASGGLVQLACPSQEDASTEIATDLILRADRALYQAKRSGRDRLVNADDPKLGMPHWPPI